jgi:hypothetical protein
MRVAASGLAILGTFALPQCRDPDGYIIEASWQPSR